MENPYSPPQAVVRDRLADPPRGRKPWLLWAIASYSVISPIFSYVGVVQIFANQPYAQRLPIYIHYLAYFIPGVWLAAGVALFLRSKLAVTLYITNFLVLVAHPALLHPRDPYVSTSLVDIYRNAASIWLFLTWVVAGSFATYVWWLNKRGDLS